jgi:hypothetical protein
MKIALSWDSLELECNRILSSTLVVSKVNTNSSKSHHQLIAITSITILPLNKALMKLFSMVGYSRHRMTSKTLKKSMLSLACGLNLTIINRKSSRKSIRC